MKRTLYGIICVIAIMTSCNKENGYFGQTKVKVEDGKMTPELLLALGRLGDPQLSPDGSTILYGVSYQSVEKNSSCRNLYACDADGSHRRQLTRCAGSLSNARWSADGKQVYFIRKGQIWKAPFKGSRLGKMVCISDVPAGISEFSISPDFGKIMYISTIKGPVTTPQDYNQALDKAQAYVATDLMYRHWDHWVTETPRTYVASLEGTITPENSTDILGAEPYELPTEPFGGMEQLCWNPDSRHIAYSCRKLTGKQYAFSTDTEIYIYDTESGKTTLIPMGGGYDTDPVWSPGGSRLAWISMERDGYEADKQRLMVADISFDEAGDARADNITDLTQRFDRDAAGPVWAEDGGSIFFNSMIDGMQAICKADIAKAEVNRLTGDDLWFDFFSPFAICDGKLLATNYSLMRPLEIVSFDPATGKYEQLSHENDKLIAKLDEPECRLESVRTTDGKDMLTWVLYPPKFSEKQQYPAIEICLGGPQGTLSQDWSYRWCYRLMAQQGYIVVMPNRRGTTAFGQQWKEQISGDYPGQNIQDYLSAGKAYKAKPFVSKLAACGASYGGYSVYELAGVHGDLFDCFIAHAGIFDERIMWYTTEESWFCNWDCGGLGEGPEWAGIRQGGAPYSPLAKAIRHYAQDPESMVRNWHTPILCIHGMMDFRIPYGQGMAAFNAAQMMGVPSKLVIFPEECHWILQPQNAIFWHETYFDWLNQWMK